MQAPSPHRQRRAAPLRDASLRAALGAALVLSLLTPPLCPRPLHAAPRPSALEAYIMSPDPARALEDPALSEADRRYLAAVDAQARGDAAGARAALDALNGLRARGEAHGYDELAEELLLRQLVLELDAPPAEGGEDPWRALSGALGVTHAAAPYAPPRPQRAQPRRRRGGGGPKRLGGHRRGARGDP